MRFVLLSGYGTVAEGPGSQPSLPLDPPASASCWPLFLAEYSILCCCTDFRILVLVYGWMSGLNCYVLEDACNVRVRACVCVSVCVRVCDCVCARAHLSVRL